MATLEQTLVYLVDRMKKFAPGSGHADSAYLCGAIDMISKVYRIPCSEVRAKYDSLK